MGSGSSRQSDQSQKKKTDRPLALTSSTRSISVYARIEGAEGLQLDLENVSTEITVSKFLKSIEEFDVFPKGWKPLEILLNGKKILPFISVPIKILVTNGQSDHSHTTTRINTHTPLLSFAEEYRTANDLKYRGRTPARSSGYDIRFGTTHGLLLTFERTLRFTRAIPRNPPLFGSLEVLKISDTPLIYPRSWREHGGVVVPIATREAAIPCALSASKPYKIRAVVNGKYKQKAFVSPPCGTLCPLVLGEVQPRRCHLIHPLSHKTKMNNEEEEEEGNENLSKVIRFIDFFITPIKSHDVVFRREFSLFPFEDNNSLDLRKTPSELGLKENDVIYAQFLHSKSIGEIEAKLSDYQITENDKIIIEGIRSTHVRVHVQSSMLSVSFSLSPNTTIDEFKQTYLEESFGIPFVRQSLEYCGALLNDGTKTLKQIGIRNGSDIALHVVGKIPFPNPTEMIENKIIWANEKSTKVRVYFINEIEYNKYFGTHLYSPISKETYLNFGVPFLNHYETVHSNNNAPKPMPLFEDTISDRTLIDSLNSGNQNQRKIDKEKLTGNMNKKGIGKEEVEEKVRKNEIKSENTNEVKVEESKKEDFPIIDDEITETLVQSVNLFGCIFCAKMFENETERNVLFAPLSVFNMLSFLQHGASPNSEIHKQIENALFSEEDFEEHLYQLTRDVLFSSKARKSIKACNSIFYDQRFEIASKFSNLSSKFGISLTKERKLSSELANKWVETQSEKTICNMTTQPCSGGDVLFCIATTLTFRSFKATKSDRKFFDETHIGRNIPFLNINSEMGYYLSSKEAIEFEGIQITSIDPEFDFLIFVPIKVDKVDDLAIFLSEITLNGPGYEVDFVQKEISLFLPSLACGWGDSLDQSYFNFLSKNGFDTISNTEMHSSGFFFRARLEFNTIEEEQQIKPGSSKTVEISKPFCVFVRHKLTQCIVLCGIVRDPSRDIAEAQFGFLENVQAEKKPNKIFEEKEKLKEEKEKLKEEKFDEVDEDEDIEDEDEDIDVDLDEDENESVDLGEDESLSKTKKEENETQNFVVHNESEDISDDIEDISGEELLDEDEDIEDEDVLDEDEDILDEDEDDGVEDENF